MIVTRASLATALVAFLAVTPAPAASRGVTPADPRLPTPRSIQSNSTTPADLVTYTTLVSAGFEWRIAGDDNDNCAVTVEYRRAGTVTWNPAQPLLRVEHGIWTHGEDPGNLLAGSVFFLAPGTSYEARLTLADPDGGAEQRVVAFATRSGPEPPSGRTLYVTPGSGGGTGTSADPFRGLAAADAAAQPGDLFRIQPGVYHGMFVITHSGAPGNPIFYSGVDAATVILDGDGGAGDTSHCVRLVGRHDLVLENLTVVNCLRPINADSSTNVVVRGCTIRPINQQIDAQGIRAAISQNLLIANNRLEMPGQWATIGRTGAYGVGGYAILIEGTGHVVCHNTIVEAWDAISLPVTDGGVPACVTSNVDVYENFVDRASDDGVQADAIRHNVRIVRNRLLNTGSGMSFQPAFGGPGYLLFNEVYNTRIEPYKFHQETFYGWTQETSGFLAYHNTTVCNRQAWRESGIWRHGRLRNNLMLGGRVGVANLELVSNYPGASLDYDGINRVNGYPTLVYVGSTPYANWPALFAGTGHEGHGIEMGIGDFVSAALPHHPEWNYPDGYGAPYAPGDFDLRLKPGAGPVDRGLALANINDGFSGAAPDLGCYESGQPLPAYGVRPAGQTLSAVASADVYAGPAPLTVHFGATASNVRGLGAGYRWDFGDGSAASNDASPVHTYTTCGTFAARIAVMDDDGSVATAGVAIQVGVLSIGSDAADPRLRLGPNAPNPVRGATRIPFSTPERARVHLAVYDLRGGRVRTLVDGALPGGAHIRTWDGCADDGRRAAAGIYFLELRAGAQRLMRRLVVAR